MKTILEAAKEHGRSESMVTKYCRELGVEKVNGKYLLSDDDINNIFFDNSSRKRIYNKAPKKNQSRKSIDKQLTQAKERRHKKNLEKNYFQMCG